VVGVLLDELCLPNLCLAPAVEFFTAYPAIYGVSVPHYGASVGKLINGAAFGTRNFLAHDWCPLSLLHGLPRVYRILTTAGTIRVSTSWSVALPASRSVAFSAAVSITLTSARTVRLGAPWPIGTKFLAVAVGRPGLRVLIDLPAMLVLIVVSSCAESYECAEGAESQCDTSMHSDLLCSCLTLPLSRARLWRVGWSGLVMRRDYIKW
jgi:hypothetical protein